MKSPWIRIWDFLVLVLVAFPLVTGGVWIRRPHLFIELSDLGVPVLLVTLLGLFLKYALKLPLEQSASAVAGREVWGRWRYALDTRTRATLWSGTFWVGLLWTLVSWRRHWAFESNSWDLGIFTNAMWNLVHGNGYVSSPKDGINLFADHQSPLFWIAAPIFALVQRPEALLAIQGFGLAAGAVALYYLGRQYLRPDSKGGWGLAALPLLYWGYLPLRNANTFDFHPEVFMLPLFLWGILRIQDPRAGSRAKGAVILLLALAAKESAGAVAAGVGLAWILGAAPPESRRFTRGAGAILALAGIGVFVFDLKMVPGYFAGQYAYHTLYDQFGNGLSDLLLAPIRQPGLFWRTISAKSRLVYLFWTLAPLGFLPLLNGRALVAALPGYLMLFMSKGDHRVSIIYHYAVEPGVGLFWALPGAMVVISGSAAHASPGRPFFQSWSRPGLWLLFWALATHGRSEMFHLRDYSPTPHMKWLSAELVPCLDPGASLSATDTLVPHWATRPWAHNLTRVTIPSGEGVECVVDDSVLKNWPMEGNQHDALIQQLPGLGYHLTYECGSLQVYERAGATTPCLQCRPVCHSP